MASTDQLPAGTTSTGAILEQVAADAIEVAPLTVADTLVNSSGSSSSSSTSSSSCDRHTRHWPELAEEEEISSENVTVSSFST
eukprot:4447374-Amphidinium_carterae.1